MKTQSEIRNRNKLLKELCEIICPNYSHTLGKSQISWLASNLFDDTNIKLNELYCSVRNSLSSPKKITLSDNEIPNLSDYRPKKESLNYKQDACKFIKDKFNINLPASPNIAGKFYESIIQNLTHNSNIKIISLEKKLLEDLEFLKENAKKGIPSCVFGNVQKIDNAYENLKKYIKGED